MSKTSYARYQADNEKARAAALVTDQCPFESNTRKERLFYKWRRAHRRAQEIFDSRCPDT